MSIICASYKYIFPSYAMIFIGIVFLAITLVVAKYFQGQTKLAYENKLWREKPSFRPQDVMILIIVVAAIARIIMLFSYPGHPDISSFFSNWAKSLANEPIFDFYYLDPSLGTIDYFHDYTPFYMYPLWIIGLINKWLMLPESVFFILLRLPSVICDFVTAYFIYKIGMKYFNQSKNLSAIFAAFYLLNPVVILNSSAWGQVDGVTTMFIVLTLWFIMNAKHTKAVITMILGVTFKLQFVFAMPVIGFYYIYKLIKEPKIFMQLLKGAGIGLALFLIINLPLTFKQIFSGDVFFPIKIYLNQVGSYGFYVLNAFNLYGAFDLNFIELPKTAIIPIINIAVIALFSVLSVILYLKKPDVKSLPLLAAFLILAVVTFSFKMHDRYMFSAIGLLVVASIVSYDAKLFAFTGAFSFLHYLNEAYLLIIPGYSFDYSDPRMKFWSIIFTLTFILFAVYVVGKFFKKKPKLEIVR